MNEVSQAPALSSRWRVALHILCGITLINYIAQIPYYIHFYFVHNAAPAPLGVLFLAATLVLFLVGYIFMLKMRRMGVWLLIFFLVLEFGGYLLHNLTGAFLKDLPLNDPLFFTVSVIGYLNFAVAFIYLVALAFGYRSIFPKNGTYQGRE